MFAGFQNALTSTGQWHELTIFSFPPEDLACQLGVQATGAMDVLKVLHIAAGCVLSPSFTHLLNLVPVEAPLRELRLRPPFASAHFLQSHWFPVFQNLTVLIVNGRDIDEPFELLPTFTQLQIFEADRLRFPSYEPNTILPLLHTLRKLRLRTCSVQWMAGRQFPCLEECAILLPRHWDVIQQHEVQLPFCQKLTYHGHPMSTARHFHGPNMRAMELKSDDCNDQRVYQQLRHLFRVDGRISNITTLHLTFQCSERVLIKVLKYMVPLQELIISIAHPSRSWEIFLESLAAKPSTTWDSYCKWEEWCSSQTWRANVLPHLKYLGIQCPKAFSRSECLDNLPLLRLVGWTRARLTPPLEHLNVWGEKGTISDPAVDYTSTAYLQDHLSVSVQGYDGIIVAGMVTRYLVTYHGAVLFPLHSTVFFRWLQHLVLSVAPPHETPFMPWLEQIKTLDITHGNIPEYSMNLDLPLTQSLLCLKLAISTSSWMLRRTFKALREFHIWGLSFPREDMSGHEGLQMGLPACAALQLVDHPFNNLRFLSCSNVQSFRWSYSQEWIPFDLTALNPFHDFLFNLPCLQELYISIFLGSGLDSLIQVVFCDAREQGVWRDIRSVEVEVRPGDSSERYHFFDRAVRHQRHYERQWKKFEVTKDTWKRVVIFRASV